MSVYWRDVMGVLRRYDREILRRSNGGLPERCDGGTGAV